MSIIIHIISRHYSYPNPNPRRKKTICICIHMCLSVFDLFTPLVGMAQNCKDVLVLVICWIQTQTHGNTNLTKCFILDTRQTTNFPIRVPTLGKSVPSVRLIWCSWVFDLALGSFIDSGLCGGLTLGRIHAQMRNRSRIIHGLASSVLQCCSSSWNSGNYYVQYCGGGVAYGR